MGFVTCGQHGGKGRGPRCCWRCDRCPVCDRIGRLRPGDYCADCVAAIKALGGVWSEYHRDYVRPADARPALTAEERAAMGGGA